MTKLQRFLKTKKGFTLVELIVVVVILGILMAVAVPVYNGIQKQNRIKICKVKRDKIASDIRLWAMQYPWNIEFAFTISSDGTSATLGPASDLGFPDLIDSTKQLILDDIFECDEAEVPCCPACNGTYTVHLIPNPNKTYCNVTVTCDGGDDGGGHNNP